MLSSHTKVIKPVATGAVADASIAPIANVQRLLADKCDRELWRGHVDSIVAEGPLRRRSRGRTNAIVLDMRAFRGAVVRLAASVTVTRRRVARWDLAHLGPGAHAR
jgi:hypothetical protein